MCSENSEITYQKQFESENVFNSDQSSFQLEIHSGRSNQGVKKVECVMQCDDLYHQQHTHTSYNNIV